MTQPTTDGIPIYCRVLLRPAMSAEYIGPAMVRADAWRIWDASAVSL